MDIVVFCDAYQIYGIIVLIDQSCFVLCLFTWPQMNQKVVSLYHVANVDVVAHRALLVILDMEPGVGMRIPLDPHYALS